MEYQSTVDALYAAAAVNASPKLCCTQTPVWKLPGLTVPKAMLEKNYGCGSTVFPRDLADASSVLYVGVGAGMEALQLAYFVRRAGGVVGIDRVPEMLACADQLLNEAAVANRWFDRSFVDLRRGDALDLPVESGTIDVAAQNCLFNIFTREHLGLALAEMFRVLRPRGKLFLSDPITTRPMPAHLAADARLRAECLSGALTLEDYLAAIVRAGFGTIEVRSKRPYRVLEKGRHQLAEHLLLESVEVVAIKDPIPADGPCIFTGCTATYVGGEECFDDRKGHVFLRDMPLGICDKTAQDLRSLGREDLVITGPTYHYAGDGCC